MEYSAILKQVEEQKKERSLAGKMFRYSGLILAVDYFSQKLNPEQIIEAAFDFVNELLSLESSAIFYARDGHFRLIREKGRNIGISIVDENETLKKLAVYHGNILVGKDTISRFFGEELFARCDVKIIIPIMVDSELEGFILIPEKLTGGFDEDDYIISEVLMKLSCNAMRNYEACGDLQEINADLDEKVFNLFAINQSSKALLSQLELDELYNLAIDVFSELTQSSTTSFVLYDEKSEKYSLKSYKFVFENIKSLKIELELKNPAFVEQNRIIIDLSLKQDRLYFDSLFTDGVNALKEMKPRYIILLNKNSSILGFVTLGATVTGMNYKKSIFELVESLASSTYISITNARLFMQVKEQKILIQNKLDRLISLNNLTKNINSSTNIETLAEITIKTLRISFAAKKCLIALYDKKEGRFNVKNSHGISPGIKVISPEPGWNRVFKGRTALAFGDDELARYFGEGASDRFGNISAALIVPVYLDKSDIEILGIIIVFEFSDSIISDEENVLTVETVAGHIAPILYNLNVIEEQKALLLPNYIEIFKNDLKKEISAAEEYNLDLFVLKIINPDEFNFGMTDTGGNLMARFTNVYPFSCNTVYMITNREPADVKEEILSLTGLYNLSYSVAVFRQDFNSFEEFITANSQPPIS